MAGPFIHDRVKDTSTTTGTGTLTLVNSAPTGYRTFGSVLANGDTCLYAIAHQSATEWETGVGTYSTTGPTLARTTVLRSSNADAAVNFSAGTKDCFIAPMRDWADKWLLQKAAYSSLAALQTGRLLFPSDGLALVRDNGTNLNDQWGPAFPLVRAAAQSWTNLNHGGSTVLTDVGGAKCLTDVTFGTVIRGIYKATPSTPYIVDALITGFASPAAAGAAEVALFWRQSSDGKCIAVTFQMRTNAASRDFKLRKFTDANTYSADYGGLGNYTTDAMLGGGFFVRLQDNSTNRIVSLSTNGQVWTQIHSVSRTDYLTADGIGFAVLPSSTDVQGTLHSWYEH